MITTTLHYDGLGRLTDVWGYSRPTTSAANDIYSYAVSDSAPTVVTTQTLNDEGGYLTSTTLYDALLRVRQTQDPTPQGGILVTDHFYDSRGWEWKTNTNWWDSTASPGSSILTIPDSQVPDQTVTAFDGLGRPDLVTSYDDSAVKSTAYTAYYGDRVTTVPPTGGTPTSTVTDALGRTTELDSYTSPPTVTTSTSGGSTTVSITGGTTQATDYSYNHRGWLSGITDAATGEDWSSGYNLLGEVTSTTDPNSGTTTNDLRPQRQPDQRHRRRRAHHHLHLRRAEPQDRRIRRALHLLAPARLVGVRQLQQRLRGHRPDRAADHRDLLLRRQRLHHPAKGLQRLRRVARRDRHPARRARAPWPAPTPSPTPTPPPPGCPATTPTPPPPAAGRCPPRPSATDLPGRLRPAQRDGRQHQLPTCRTSPTPRSPRWPRRKSAPPPTTPTSPTPTTRTPAT